MNLYLWKAPMVTDTDEARRLLEAEDERVFEPSADLARFFNELMERLPPHDAFTEDELRAGATPWADSPEASDRLVSLSLRWSADDDHLDTIVDLAVKYDLVLYDPQGPSFHSPVQDAAPYSPGAGEFLRGGLLVAIGLLVAVAAWRLSIPVLSWILVFVGGFVALVALFLLGAISQDAWRARASR